MKKIFALVFMIMILFGCSNIKYYQKTDSGFTQVNPWKLNGKVIRINNPGLERYQLFSDDGLLYNWWYSSESGFELAPNSFMVISGIRPGAYNLVVKRIDVIGKPMSDFYKVLKFFGKDPDKVTIGINVPRVTTKSSEGYDLDINLDEEFQ